MRKKMFVCVFVLAVLAFVSSSAIARKVKIVELSSRTTPEAARRIEVAFESQHPDIDLDLKVTADSRYFESLLLRGATGNLPDVFFLWPGERLERFAQAGLLIELTGQRLKSIGIDMSDYPYVPIRSCMYGDKLFGLPCELITRGCYVYNVRMFKESGLPEPTADLPWSEFRENARKLTVRDADGEVQRYGFFNKWPRFDFVFGFGGRFVDNTYNPTKATFGSEAARKGMQEYLDMVYKDECAMSFEKFIATGGIKAKIFNTEKVAMIWTSVIKNVGFVKAPFEWNWQRINTSAENQGVLMDVGLLVVSKDCSDVDAALEFVKWYGIEGWRSIIQNECYGTIMTMPWAKDALQVFSKRMEGLPPKNWMMFVESRKIGIPVPQFPGCTEFYILLGDVMNKIKHGKAGVETLVEAEKKAQAYLDELRSK